MNQPKKIAPYQLPLELEVRGATAPDGKPYVQVAASGKKAWVPREAFSGGASAALRMLIEAGIPLVAKEWASCRDKVAALEEYPLRPLIAQPGWNPPYFALCNGKVFSPDGAGKPVVLFPKNEQKCAAAGSIAEWRRMTSALRGQHIATFITATAYAAPLLALSNRLSNLGFELAGPGAVGKSTVQRLAAVVSGPADSPLESNYWITANATMNGFEDVLVEHNDMPMIIEEANLYAAADHVASRAAKFNELVFKLTDGTPKRRYRSGPPRRSRFVFVTSTNEALAQVLAGRRVAVAEAAADRLLTIPIDETRPYKIFDHLTKGHKDGAALAEFFQAGIRKCHGVSMRVFLKHLVAEQKRSPDAIQRHIDGCITRFRTRAGVDGNDGSEIRVADSFGLVYAAAKLAVRYRAISRRIRPLDAALACYWLNQTTRKEAPDLGAKLRELPGCFEALYISHDRLPALTDEELNAYPAIEREGRNGVNEVLLTPEQLRRAFPDQRQFFADPKIREWLLAEDGRRQTKRQIRSNRGPERVHCFRIPGMK